MRTGTREPLHRRNIVMTGRTVERISSLRAKTDASTDTEVMRFALALYDKIIDSVLSGSRVQLVAPDGSIRELELLVANGMDKTVRELELMAANGK